jgi:hypothetical protein
MRNYLQSRLVRIGLVGLVLGTGPLVTVVLLAEHGHGLFGIRPDPNPNPVGFGILAGLTFWPSVIAIAVGVWKTRRTEKRNAEEYGGD